MWNKTYYVDKEMTCRDYILYNSRVFSKMFYCIIIINYTFRNIEIKTLESAIIIILNLKLKKIEKAFTFAIKFIKHKLVTKPH